MMALQRGLSLRQRIQRDAVGAASNACGSTPRALSSTAQRQPTTTIIPTSSACSSLGGLSAFHRAAHGFVGRRAQSQVRMFSSTPKDPYQVLGISRTASEAEIKKAYKVLAKKYHPDRHPGEGKKSAEQKFQEIAQAYQTLTDPSPQEQQMPRGGGFHGGFPGGGFPGGFQGGFPGGFPGGFGFPGGQGGFHFQQGPFHGFGGDPRQQMGFDISDFLNDIFANAMPQPVVITQGDVVTISSHVRQLILESRRAELDTRDDALRNKCVGKSGKVVKVNPANNSAKLAVDGVGEVWIPAGAIQPPQQKQRRAEPQQNARGGGGGQDLSSSMHLEQGPDGEVYVVRTRRVRTPQGTIREEVTKEKFR